MARRVERGDLWLYRFGRPDRRRPVLVLSRPAALSLLRTAVVAPVSSTIHGIPSEILVGEDDGMKSPSAVNLDHLYTVEQADLKQWLGRLPPARMAEVCEALEIALGCR